jgi:shikimate 5-dehydrogenase
MGFNRSISHKFAVTAHLNELGEPATLIGAVKSELP